MHIFSPLKIYKIAQKNIVMTFKPYTEKLRRIKLEFVLF